MPPHSVPGRAPTLGRPMANRRKVTVIDDDRSVLKATERLLCARGFEVETFASAEAFLARTATRPTTCLVLDIHLGGMSGIELRRRLKVSNPNLPVIFITGMDSEATRKDAMEAGCVAYLQKPFLSHALIEAIERARGDDGRRAPPSAEPLRCSPTRLRNARRSRNP